MSLCLEPSELELSELEPSKQGCLLFCLYLRQNYETYYYLKLIAAPAPEIVSFLSILNIRFITGAFGALAIAAGATGAEVVGAGVIEAYIIGAKVVGAESAL
jgi:hypothetical protein